MKAGATGTAVLGVGLYAYDLSCADDFCNLIDNKDDSGLARFPMSHCVDIQVKNPMVLRSVSTSTLKIMMRIIAPASETTMKVKPTETPLRASITKIL